MSLGYGLGACTQCSKAMQQPQQDDTNRQVGIRTERTDLNALTYINVFGQQFVGHFVLVQDVVVDSRAGEGGAEEEAKEPKTAVVLANHIFMWPLRSHAAKKDDGWWSECTQSVYSRGKG